ncbi:tryptophan synthase alpha chain-like [Zingiber officinale]|uniref:tryptophan synthase alpha chain-like n=1 Tax=Zingiber officinale TaxID=94328 RepID=UPI001C4B480C|nr:tryptophan synthase alpha chain-like [Zingiber officinale]
MASATMIVAGNRLKLSSSTSTFYSVPRILHPKSSLRLRAQASSIAETFSALKRQEKVAFIPYITAGDPDLSTTAKALKMLSRCGADLIELGLPFSDPVLDGPVIQASHKRALANKTSPKAVISMLKEVVPQISCPIVVFSYYNMILSYKSEWFLAALEDAGAQGLIVPDLPFEESATLREEALKKNIDMVLLTTPTTPRKKMEAIADASGGFLYLVSSAGVTGARPTVNSQVQYLLRDIKRASEKPVAVGFGVSKPQHVRQICSWGADGVIVGSAIVRLLGEAEFAEEGLRQMKSFVECLTAALPSRNPALEKSTTPNFFREDEFWGRRAAPQPKSTVLVHRRR